MKHRNTKNFVFTLITLMLFFSNAIYAGDGTGDQTEEEAMAAMQRRLNAEVMEKPFSVEDEKKIDSYINNAMKKNLKPPQKAPSYWKSGNSCADIYSYGWNSYRNCRYYRRYYGHYW